jgi:predicted acylesterase/phospholipase RssA
MTSEVFIAVLSFLGTAAGSIVSILTANALTNYKIEELTKKVEKHNSVIDRVYKLEQGQAVTEETIKVVNNRIKDLEHKTEVLLK